MTTLLTKEKPQCLMQIPIVLGIVSLFFLSACGGASGGKGAPGSASRTTVSGAVQAPDGQFAKAGPLQVLARLVGVEAAAAPSGMLPVPAGTRVELVRINASGTVLATLAATAVANGRYSFDLTALGLGFSGDLVVRAVGSRFLSAGHGRRKNGEHQSRVGGRRQDHLRPDSAGQRHLHYLHAPGALGYFGKHADSRGDRAGDGRSGH